MRPLRTDAFLTPLNIRHILLATAPLALVTMAQFNVLMVRGFDVSVGAVISLTVVIGSFLMAEDIERRAYSSRVRWCASRLASSSG